MMNRLRDPRGARKKGRFAWARLNADTLFLALLAVGSGAFSLIDPTFDRITAIRGSAAVLHYAQYGAYIAAGVMLGLALLIASVRVEVLARWVLIGGVGLGVWRNANFFGLDGTATERQLVLLLIVLVTMLLRFSVLLGNDGLIVTRPAVGEDDD